MQIAFMLFKTMISFATRWRNDLITRVYRSWSKSFRIQIIYCRLYEDRKRVFSIVVINIWCVGLHDVLAHATEIESCYFSMSEVLLCMYPYEKNHMLTLSICFSAACKDAPSYPTHNNYSTVLYYIQNATCVRNFKPIYKRKL